MIESLLGYKSVWRVISLFAETPRKTLSTSVIREQTRLGNQALEEALQRLVNAHILFVKKGKPSTYWLNLEHPYLQPILTLLETERRTLRHLDYHVRIALAELLRGVLSREDFVSAYLFGSHAKGYAREDSDIDVAIILKKPVTELELATLQARSDKLGRVQVHAFSEEEFKKHTPMNNQVRNEGINLLRPPTELSLL